MFFYPGNLNKLVRVNIDKKFLINLNKPITKKTLKNDIIIINIYTVMKNTTENDKFLNKKRLKKKSNSKTKTSEYTPFKKTIINSIQPHDSHRRYLVGNR